jgi:hypothetical protein
MLLFATGEFIITADHDRASVNHREAIRLEWLSRRVPVTGHVGLRAD